jgi:tetratricopeptide (TPR) repeat protein
MRTSKHLIGLALLGLTFGTAACGKKGKNDDTNTPGKASAAVTDPSKASAEAKASFNEVAQRYKTAKERGSLSASTVWEECGNAEKAEDIYQQLVQEVPKYDLSYNNLGVIYWNRRQEGKALDYFKRAVEANSATKAPRNNLAAALRDKYTDSPDQDTFTKAESELQRVLAVDSNNRLAYENLARLYYDRGRLKDKSYLLLADLVVTQAIAKEKKGDVTSSPDIYNIKGLLFMQQDNQVDALKAFKKATEIDKNHTDANMNIAMIAIRFRDYKSAEESLSIALKDRRQKKNVEAFLGLGVAQRGLRKYGDAEKSFKKAIEVKGSDPRALYNLGILYHEHIGPESEKKNESGNFDKRPYETAKSYFDKFVSQSSGSKDLAKYSDDAKNRVNNIKDYFKNIEDMKKLEAEAKKLEEQAKKAEDEEKNRLRKLEEQMRNQQTPSTPPAEKPADKGAAKPAEKKPGK